MQKLILEATQYTPKIVMDPAGIISMEGKSYPENTFEFYMPVMQWLEKYFKGDVPSKTVVNMEIIYFNSSSSKLFFDFFDVLDEQRQVHDIEINWIFNKDNGSAKEAGEDFIDDFEELTINLVETDL